MENYYQRYMAGECRTVWKELLLRGDSVRHGALAAEAMSVCREFVERSFRNLAKLRSKLTDLGYRFRNPDESLRPPAKTEMACLAQVEETLGLLPLVVRAWYEAIGSVDFSQDRAQLHGQQLDGKTNALAGLGHHQVLIFESLPKCLSIRKELLMDADEDEDAQALLEHFLPTGGYGSNSEPKGFTLPSSSIDAVLYNEGFGDVRFADDLRAAFQWGGFPFWKRLIERPGAPSPVKVTPDFQRLLPMLIDGLVEV